MSDIGDTLVIALGGNAIARAGDDGTIDAQYRRAKEAVAGVAKLICDGRHVVLTHGNGPVIGSIVLRGEIARSQVPPMPLFIAGADSEGGIGLMLQQTLGNELRRCGSDRIAATIVTQVVVDRADPAFRQPVKPIGSAYTPEDAAALASERGWSMRAGADGTFKRVVASPKPLRIVELAAIRSALESGVVPIAAGGGGVPVIEGADGSLSGIDAVIDKDWTSALLAEQLGADGLVILMEADGVHSGWGTPYDRKLDRMTVAEARDMLASGSLEEGSVAPKVAAAAHFAEKTGRPAVLCKMPDLAAGLEGRAGTTLVP